MNDLPPLSAGETLSPGDTNDHVLALQHRLAEHGYFHDSPDGVFGESTEAAVREFQRERGLIEDGAVGEQTWDAVGLLGHVGGLDGQGTPAADELSEDGHWRWDGQDWVPAAHGADDPHGQDPATGGEPGNGVVSEDGQWVWDGEQWRPNDEAGELTPELFQEVIAQSIQVNSSATA